MTGRVHLRVFTLLFPDLRRANDDEFGRLVSEGKHLDGSMEAS